MNITFTFPVVTWLDPEDPEDSEISSCEAVIRPIQLDHPPYEMNLDARGYSFHLIFGNQVNGNFLCIPNWQFGCELADLDDKSWNMDFILHADSQLDYEDATAITWALSVVSSYIDR